MRPLKKIAFILIALGLIVFIGVFFFHQKVDSFTIKNKDFYYYDSGSYEEYKEKITFTKKESQTFLKAKEIEKQVDSLPFYSLLETEVFFPCTMAYINPEEDGIMKRINYYSFLYQKDNCFFIKMPNATKELRRGFLFDGNNLYFFLEPVIITVNNKTFELPALSHVVVDYNTKIEMYSYSQNQYFYEEISENSIKAEVESKLYSINLISDSLITQQSEQLLIRKVDKLPKLS